MKFEPTATASAGTVLMRDWHGVAREVRMLDRGVLYKKAIPLNHPLEVATLIFGAHDGPRFFGLRSDRVLEATHGQK